MESHSDNQTLILINPKARHGRQVSSSDDWEARKIELFDALGVSQAQVVFTTPEDHGEKTVKRALKRGVKRVVVIGGDGTLSEVIQGFFENGKPISPEAIVMVMPGGRGDDFFKNLTPQSFYSGASAWNLGLEVIKNGSPHPTDVGMIQWRGSKELPRRYFINIASFGFPGLVVNRVQSKKGFFGNKLFSSSAWTYGLQGLAALKEYKPLPVQVKVDDKEFYSGPLNSGFILNGRYNAGGLCWDPDAQIDDGLFHLVLLEPTSQWTNLKNGSKLLMKDSRSLEGAYRISGKKIEVLFQSDSPKTHSYFEIDGDCPEDSSTHGAVFEILPGAIQIQQLIN